MDWKSQLDETSAALAVFREVRPATGAGFTAMHRAAMSKDGSMTLREKELVALGIDVTGHAGLVVRHDPPRIANPLFSQKPRPASFVSEGR